MPPEMIAPLQGLLLAGGKSRRMGSDKASLVVADGLSLRERGMQLLRARTEHAFLSIASDDDRNYDEPVLRDLHPDQGPLAGLQAAFHHDPASAWLVLACDLPLLGNDVLHHLVSHRDPAAEATCFTSRFDGNPEPMCTIYEPAAAPKLAAAFSQDLRCARTFLSSLSRKELALPDPSALDNCNRPEDLEEARHRLAGQRSSKTVVVDFCGQLREDAGTGSEAIRTEAATAAGLWEELRMARNLSLQIDAVRLAVNDEFQPWTTVLRDGDRLALFPPFAGG